MATRVLAFMAHPDDVEFTCAGTLARLKDEAACEIAIATMTSGDCGSVKLGAAEIARVRHQEAERSAAILEAEYYCAGSIDLLVMYDEPTLRRVTEILRKARPNIVITQPPADYMVDHETASRLVRMATFAAPCPNFLTYDLDPAPPIEDLPHLYYVDPVDMVDPMGRPVSPEFVVDVSAVIGKKEKMLASHASQREWLREHHGVDEYIDSMKRTATTRGKMINRDFGEGFSQHKGHPYPQNNIIDELLKVQ